LYDKGGELALQEISRRKPILKNRTPIEIEQAVIEMAIEQPAWGQVRISEALKRRGLSISPISRITLPPAAPPSLPVTQTRRRLSPRYRGGWAG
jgi:hypothetical protein